MILRGFADYRSSANCLIKNLSKEPHRKIRHYVRKHGEDMPEIRNRKWEPTQPSTSGVDHADLVQATLMGRGFVAEGYGDPPVAMCSPH